MNFDEILKLSKNNPKEFTKNFGYYLMTVSRKDLPKLIEIAMNVNDPIINKKILNEIPFLLNKVKIGELGNLLSVLFYNPMYYKKVVSMFDYLSNFFAPNNIEQVISAFLRVNPNSKVIANNYETFLENAKTKVQVMQIIQSTSHIDKCKNIIETYNSVILELDDYRFLADLNIGTMLKLINYGCLDEIKDVFTTYSNGNLKDVKFMSNGFTSTVFSVGDKVIKIGKKRIKFDSFFSKYLLQPYCRKELKDFSDNVIATIEVQDACLSVGLDPEKVTNFIDKINSEENFIWADNNPSNVFLLLKDNNRKIPPSEDGFSYSGVDTTVPIGKKGDLVIGDTDFIFSKDDFMKRENSYYTPPHNTTFSFILPTYNMEKYLGNCLNSILNQTCDDFEVLIINDGSTDSSKKIAEQYSNIDKRIKVLSFENGGLSVARNRGIKAASGDYLLLVDPDDTIEPELLEKLLPYVKNGVETIRFGALVQDDSPQKDKHRFNRPYYPEIISGIEALEKWNTDKRYATAWLYCISKNVYKRSNFEFPKVKIYEDVASIPKLIANSNSVALLDYIGYNYIQHDDTITNGKTPEKQLSNLDGFIYAYDKIMDTMNDFFDEKGCSESSRDSILDGFFNRLENKFQHTNLIEKDTFAYHLLDRHKRFKIDYNDEYFYYNFAQNAHNQIAKFCPSKDKRRLKYKDTTVMQLGSYDYCIGDINNSISLYKIEKEGQFNYTDSFLSFSNIDFDKLKSSESYRKMVFENLLSYANLLLAESINGSYIGDVYENPITSSMNIKFDPNNTTFARNMRAITPRLQEKNEEKSL